jgi:hypothetical protein
MPHRLTIILGQDTGATCLFDRSAGTIGRSSNAMLRLEDEAVAWEYFLPQLRRTEGNQTATRATVYSAERFAAEELDFEFNQP